MISSYDCDSRAVAVYEPMGVRAAVVIRTLQATYSLSATKINLLMLFRERAAIYCETLMKHAIGRMHNFSVKAGGIYSNH